MIQSHTLFNGSLRRTILLDGCNIEIAFNVSGVCYVFMVVFLSVDVRCTTHVWIFDSDSEPR